MDLLEKENIEIIQKMKIFDGENEIIVTGIGEYYKDKNLRHRYSLKVKIDNNANKALTVIMLNPSEKLKGKDGFFVDQTVTNLVKIANENKYNSMEILNLFSIIEPNSNIAQKNFLQNKESYVINKNNIDYILSVIEQSNNILVAWGDKFKNDTRHEQVKSIIDELKSNNKNIYTFCNSKKNYPKHPGRIDMNCCRNCYGRNDKINLIPFEFN